MKDWLKIAGVVAMLIFFAWFFVASLAWKVRNPKANDMTRVTYFFDVMKFKKLDTFQ